MDDEGSKRLGFLGHVGYDSPIHPPFVPMLLQSQRARNLLFLFFLFGFFVTAPIVVLYTMGYRPTGFWGSFVTTGVLVVQTAPKGAVVTLPKSHLSFDAPATIHSLPPGVHPIEIQRDGYEIWRGSVQITGGQTTTISLPLLREPVTPTTIVERPLAKEPLVRSSPTLTQSLLITDDEAFRELSLIHHDDQHRLQILSRRPTCTDIATVQWHPRRPFVAVQSCGQVLMIDTQNDRVLSVNEKEPEMVFLGFDPLSNWTLWKMKNGESVGHDLVSSEQIVFPIGTVQASLIPNTKQIWFVIQEIRDKTILGTFRVGEPVTHIQEQLSNATITMIDGLVNTVVLHAQTSTGSGRCGVIDLTSAERTLRWPSDGVEQPEDCRLGEIFSPELLVWKRGYGEIAIARSLTDTPQTLTRLSGETRVLSWIPESTLLLVEHNGRLVTIDTQPSLYANQTDVSRTLSIHNPSLVQTARETGILSTVWTPPTEGIATGNWRLEFIPLTTLSRRFIP